GLSGVWSFKSKRLKITLLPELEDIVWRERTVYLAFDSDRATNEDIIRAEQALTRELTKRGARVRTIILPPSATGDNRGLDDYLLAEGCPAYDKLVEVADAQPPSAIERLNAEFGLVMDKSGIVETSTGRAYTYNNFRNTFAQYNADGEDAIRT